MLNPSKAHPHIKYPKRVFPFDSFSFDVYIRINVLKALNDSKYNQVCYTWRKIKILNCEMIHFNVCEPGFLCKLLTLKNEPQNSCLNLRMSTLWIWMAKDWSLRFVNSCWNTCRIEYIFRITSPSSNYHHSWFKIRWLWNSDIKDDILHKSFLFKLNFECN